MTKPTINIRTAIPADANQIAHVHIDSWRTTYRGIMPDEYLDKLDLQARVNYWDKILAEQCDHVFVADIDGLIVGFATAGKSREDNNFDSELYAVYVLQQHQRKNIGRLLMRATANHLQARGYQSMYVWVLVDNHSKQFYERLGGEHITEKTIEIGGRQLKEVAFGWRAFHQLTTPN